MTCWQLSDWARDNRGTVRNFMQTNPGREEILLYLTESYPQGDDIKALASRLPTWALQLIAETWSTADVASRDFTMNSVGPAADQVPSVPAPPENGLRITVQFDGGESGNATIYFHGLGEAEHFFSRDRDEFSAAGEGTMPWYSAGPDGS